MFKPYKLYFSLLIIGGAAFLFLANFKGLAEEKGGNEQIHSVFFPIDFYKEGTSEDAVEIMNQLNKVFINLVKPSHQSEKLFKQTMFYMGMGFFAEMAKTRPDQFVEIGQKFDMLGREVRGLLIIGALYGQNEVGQSFLTKWLKGPFKNEVEAVLARSSNYENMLDYPIISPDILSATTGAYSASGDPRHLENIIVGFVHSYPGGEKPNALMTHLLLSQIIIISNSDGLAKNYFLDVAQKNEGVPFKTIIYTLEKPENTKE